MEQLLKANDNSTNAAEKKIAMLEYITDFLAYFTRSAEAMELSSVAYFLAMAASDASDQLKDLKAANAEAKRNFGSKTFADQRPMMAI